MQAFQLTKFIQAQLHSYYQRQFWHLITPLSLPADSAHFYYDFPDSAFLDFILYQLAILERNHLYLLALQLTDSPVKPEHLARVYCHGLKIMQLIRFAERDRPQLKNDLKGMNKRAVYVAYRIKQYFTRERQLQELLDYTQPSKMSIGSAFLSGLGIGFLIILCVLTGILWSMGVLGELNIQKAKTIFPVFRGLVLVSLYLWVFTFSSYVMTLKQINYMLIAKLPIRGLALSDQLARSFLFSSLVLSAFLLWLVDRHFNILHFVNSQFLPLVCWLVLLGYIFNPLPVLNYEFRTHLLQQTIRMFCSPFTGYNSFVSSFIGDQLSSCLNILKDVLYTGCFYSCYFISQKPEACEGIQIKRISNLYLPLLLYFVKLGVCYHDYRHGIRLSTLSFKIFKYLLSIATCLAAYFLKASYLWQWLVLAFFTASVHFYYDLKVEWNFGNRKKESWVQIGILASNLLLRVAYLISLSPKAIKFIGLPVQEYCLVSSSFQIIRRGFWNFVLLENQEYKIKQSLSSFTLLQLRVPFEEAKINAAQISRTRRQVFFRETIGESREKEDFEQDLAKLTEESSEIELEGWRKHILMLIRKAKSQ